MIWVIYTKNPARPTDAQLLNQVYTLYSHLGRWPTCGEMEDDEVFITATSRIIHSRFGGHRASIDAVKVARDLLSPAEIEALRDERTKIMSQLQDRYGDNEYWLPRSTYTNDLNIPDVKDFSRCCGGLDAALRELGLPVCFPSREDLIAALQKAAQVLGRTPFLVDAEAKLCYYPASAFLNEFGTWNQGIKAAGLKVNLDQPGRRETIAKRHYSFYRHPNQCYTPRSSKNLCTNPS